MICICRWKLQWFWELTSHNKWVCNQYTNTADIKTKINRQGITDSTENTDKYHGHSLSQHFKQFSSIFTYFSIFQELPPEFMNQSMQCPYYKGNKHCLVWQCLLAVRLCRYSWLHSNSHGLVHVCMTIYGKINVFNAFYCYIELATHIYVEKNSKKTL